MLPTPAPQPATPALPATPSLEYVIGRVTAALAASIGARLGELQQGQRACESTLQRGAEQLGVLVQLYTATAGELNFDCIALQYGRRVLQEHRGTLADGGVDDGDDVDELLAGAIDLLHQVTRARMN